MDLYIEKMVPHIFSTTPIKFIHVTNTTPIKFIHVTNIGMYMANCIVMGSRLSLVITDLKDGLNMVINIEMMALQWSGQMDIRSIF
jgi:hypothetical protein